MFYYEELFKNIITGNNDGEDVLYLNNKLLVADMISKVGNYIVTYNLIDESNNISEYKVYNNEGEELNINDELYYLGNNLYQVYNKEKQSFSLLDNKLNVISDNLNFVTCSFNNYCSVTDEKDSKLLYKNGKRITTNVYEDIDITKDNIVAKTLFNTYIYIYGNENEINIDTKEELNINEDEMIEKYGLENIELKIKEDNELFKKYAYIVENNDNLLDYKKQVMDMFEVVVDNKEYLNELSLLSKLKQLNISYVDNLEPGVGAIYSDIDTKIDLKEKDNYTLYHELMHFIDFSFNNDNNMYNIYRCGDKYEVGKGFDNRCEIINIDSNFIIEAGAEVYSGKYFTHELEAYTPALLILEGIEYIYGTEELKDWYFKSDSYFKKIWLDMGYTYDDAMKIIAGLSSKTKIMYSGDDNTIFIVYALIDLYKYKKSRDFMSDNKFKYILRCLIEFRRDFTSSKYSKELGDIINENDIIIKELSSKLGDYVFYKELGDFIIIDNKEYISSLCYKGTETGSLLISYDFDNNKVLDYKYTAKN